MSTATTTSSLARVSSSGSVSSSPSAPPPDALHLYAYGIDEDAVAAAIDSMKLSDALWLTEAMHDADAILALRSKVKQASNRLDVWGPDHAAMCFIPVIITDSVNILQSMAACSS